MSTFDTALYRSMLRIRLAEEQIARWVEDGTATTPCHLSIGQEAIPAGVCAHLREQDTVWGGHRSHGHYLAKGGDLTALFAEVLGRVTGCCGGRGGSMHLQDRAAGVAGTIPLIGATVPMAVGAALSYRMGGHGRVDVAFFGDGAMEEGHVLEAMNMAALYRLPVLFVCENNLYASHMHINDRRPGESSLTTVADALGLRAKRCDGNDVDGVRIHAGDLIAHVRRFGPAFLECMTYRHRGHVGASYDLDVGVQRSDEVRDWMARDPIERQAGRLLTAQCAEINREVHDEVVAAAGAALAAPEVSA